MSEKRRVVMNLLQQDVYVRDFVSPFDEKRDYLQDDYVSMDLTVRSAPDAASVDVFSKQPYPITPEYVNSYADGTNYRLDVSQAVSRPAPGVNLGDVAAMQDLMKLSPDQLRGVVERLVSLIRVSPGASSVVVGDENKDGGDNG